MDALVRRNVAAAGKPNVLHWAQVVIYLGIAVVAVFVAFDAAHEGDIGTVVLMAMLGSIMAICGLMVLRWALVSVRPKDVALS